jgi:RNA polymerase sigma-70 factor (ECF subfamily)
MVDREAVLADVYRRHAGDVLGYALRRCSADDAADVVSETFLVAWRRLDDLPEEPAVRPWLLGIARRVLANQRRGIRRRAALVERASSFLLPHLRTAPAIDINSDAQMVNRALEALPHADQELLRLVAWEELTPIEIATVMGLSNGNVRKRLFRARKRLNAELDRMDPERQPNSGHVPGRDDQQNPEQSEELRSP